MDEPGELALVRRLRDENRTLSAEMESLKNDGGGGTFPPMGDVDAKIAASEARTDTKFAKLEGKLDLIVASLETVKAQAADAKGEARTTRRTVVATGMSLGALLIAIFALYVNSFNLGTRVDDIARIEAQRFYTQMATAPLSARQRVVGQQPPRAAPSPLSR